MGAKCVRDCFWRGNWLVQEQQNVMKTRFLTREELVITTGILLTVVLVDHAIQHRRVKRELRLYREAFINAADEYDALAQVTDDLLG